MPSTKKGRISNGCSELKKWKKVERWWGFELGENALCVKLSTNCSSLGSKVAGDEIQCTVVIFDVKYGSSRGRIAEYQYAVQRIDHITKKRFFFCWIYLWSRWGKSSELMIQSRQKLYYAGCKPSGSWCLILRSEIKFSQRNQPEPKFSSLSETRFEFHDLRPPDWFNWRRKRYPPICLTSLPITWNWPLHFQFPVSLGIAATNINNAKLQYNR